MSQRMTPKQYETQAVTEMNRLLAGQKVKGVRAMTVAEAREMFWDHRALVIEFDDGTLIFAASDDEGNNAGALCGRLPDGSDLTVGVFR